MLYRTEGVILRGRPLREAEVVVEFMSRHFGLRAAVARGVGRTTSRWGSSLEPFSHVRLAFWGKEDAPLPRLLQADILEPFQHLREDLRCYLQASEMAELLLRLLPARSPHEDAFELLLWAQTHLRGQPQLVPLAFQLRLLQIAGYGPRLQRCGRCPRLCRTFYPSQGSVLCPRHAPSGERPLTLSPALQALARTLLQWPLQKLHRLRLDRPLRRELQGLLQAHLQRGLGLQLHSAKFDPRL